MTNPTGSFTPAESFLDGAIHSHPADESQPQPPRPQPEHPAQPPYPQTPDQQPPYPQDLDQQDLYPSRDRRDTPTQRALRTLIEWVVVAICALALALVMQRFLVQAYSIPSRSMEPTLAIGDRVVVFKLGYRFGDVGRGDVVVFNKPHESAATDDLIKRVVAVGGDRFELRDGTVYVNDEPIDEPYLAAQEITRPKAAMPGCDNAPDREMCVVPDGTVLVLGDNREFSRDSRFFGPVEVDAVVGRAFMKYWPPTSIGGI